MPTLDQLKEGLIRAHKAGDFDSARKLAAVITHEEQQLDPIVSQIPGMGQTEVMPPTLPSTFADKAVGAGEAALAGVTGATSGTIGMIGGTLKGIANEMISGQFGTQAAADRIEQQAMEGMLALTYAPRTPAGQGITEAIGEVTEPLAAVAPMTAQLQPIVASTRAAAPVARATAQRITQPVIQATKQVAERVKQAAPGQPKVTPGTGTSVGAQAVDKAVSRQAQADELPIPVKLTEGQRTRDFEAQRFERETAKLPEEGAPLRERFAEQNLQLQQNMDAFIDATGAEITNLRGIGEIVDRALRQRASRDKKRIRALYKEAEKAGEMESPVEMTALATYLNENRALRTEEGLLNKVQRQLDTLEVSQGNFQDGSLVLKPITLQQAESIRRFINDNTNSIDAPEVRIATQLKNVIDAATEGKGGDKYKRARRARAKYAREYENVGLVKQLLTTKRGTDDRVIAMEDVLRKTVLDPSTSLDIMRHVKRLLQTKAGKDGKQAWKELQGGALRHIQEQMTKNVARDQSGNPIVSPSKLDRAIMQLDKTGKLDFIFGKRGAEQLRVINDVAKDILTSPPGTINTSNTASVLAGLMDVAISGTAGVPAPVMSGFRIISKSIRDKKLRARVKQALGD